MNWTLFIVFLIVGIVIYVAWMFFAQRQLAKLSMMLYRNGDADGYLKELESFQSKLFFNTRLRTLMQIDAYMMKEDIPHLDECFAKADGIPLRAGDRMIVLQKEIAYEIQQGKQEKAREDFQRLKDLEKQITKKETDKYQGILKEMTYLVAIRLDHDGQYAKELEQKSKQIKDALPAGVYLFKAAQSYYLENEKKQCQICLEQAEVKLRGTPYHDYIQKLLDSKNYDALMDAPF